MKNLIREEKGTAIVMAALMMVVLLGFAALAIDGGYLYFCHTKLQDIADASALAAAQEFGGGQTGSNKQKETAAFVKAVDFAAKNGLATVSKDDTTNSAVLSYGTEPGTMNVTFPHADEIKVDITVVSNLYFARVLGFNKTPVKVSATANVGIGNLVPLLLFWTDFDYHIGLPFVTLNYQPGDTGGGNFGYIDFDSSSMFDDYLMYGYNGDLFNDTNNPSVTTYYSDTQTGARVGQITQSLDYRFSQCFDSCTYDHYKEDCPRIVVFPIASIDDKGKTQVTIDEFAVFWIESYKNKTLTGIFIKKIDTLNYNSHYARIIE